MGGVFMSPDRLRFRPLAETVALMRQLGVVSLSVEGLVLSLGPKTQVSEPPAAETPVDPAFDDSPCHCGHPRLTEHGDGGLCLHACSLEVCRTTR